VPLKAEIFAKWKSASEASANIFKVVRTFSELKKLAAKTVNFLKIKKFACEAGANVFKVVEKHH